MSHVNSQYNVPRFERCEHNTNEYKTHEFRCKSKEYDTDEFRCRRTGEHNTDEFRCWNKRESREYTGEFSRYDSGRQ